MGLASLLCALIYLATVKDDKMKIDGRCIARRTPVFDHAGSKLYDASREQVVELLQRSNVIAIRSTHMIRKICLQGPDPAHLALSGSHHRRPIGTPHRNDSYHNVRNCWHLDRVPSYYARCQDTVLR